MSFKRLICRRFSNETWCTIIVWTVIVIVYCLYLRSTIAKGGWYVPGFFERGSPNPAIMWKERVVVACEGCKDNDTKEKLKADEQTDARMLGVVRNKEDKYVRDIGYKNHAFNALVSNNIGKTRELPDTRHKICRSTPSLPIEQLPTASIVMCFYNEHRMTLMRSLNSIIERTPPQLLKEIILVDDFSDLPELEFHLVAELHQYEKVHYMRNAQREGLIRSRVIGAHEAIGEVLIFLDSHIEVNQEWAEPLLSLIKQENSTLAVPVIDLINADTFEYTASPLVRGGFNWGLHFKWENLPEGTLKSEQDFKGPFKSPTMAGGLFAVNREYFHHIGEYDMGMDIWGGENVEISFRVWLCGGAIKIVPCSRVGHIFRKRRPYTAPDGANTMLKNSLRLANVWMDDYKQYFLKHDTSMRKDMDYGDITERLHLRTRLQCHDFAWYLKNIYPELRLPGQKPRKSAAAPAFQPWHSRKRNYIGEFMVKLSGTQLCASVVAPKVKGFWKKGSTLTLQSCLQTKNQIWHETDKAEIVLDKLLCLEAVGDSEVVINKCHEMLGDQQWQHKRSEQSPIYNMATGTCLRAEEARNGAGIVLDLCSKSENNAWDIQKLS